jgi:hypothetical protein
MRCTGGGLRNDQRVGERIDAGQLRREVGAELVSRALAPQAFRKVIDTIVPDAETARRNTATRSTLL